MGKKIANDSYAHNIGLSYGNDGSLNMRVDATNFVLAQKKEIPSSASEIGAAPSDHNHDDSYPNISCSGRVDGTDNVTVRIPNWREYEPWCALVIGICWSNMFPNISFQLIGNYAGDGSNGINPINIYCNQGTNPYQGYINQVYRDVINYKFRNTDGGTVWVIGLPNHKIR